MFFIGFSGYIRLMSLLITNMALFNYDFKFNIVKLGFFNPNFNSKSTKTSFNIDYILQNIYFKNVYILI